MIKQILVDTLLPKNIYKFVTLKMKPFKERAIFNLQAFGFFKNKAKEVRFFHVRIYSYIKK